MPLDATPKIFISYAWKNQTIAKRLQSDLQRDGVEVFVDYEKIAGGDSLPQRISAALDWCNTLVLLWSADSAESYYVKQEWSSAFHLQKKIIACVLDGAKLPALLSGNLYLNFAPYETGYAQLCRSLGVEPKVIVASPDEKRETPLPVTPKRKSITDTFRRKPKPRDPAPVLKPPEIVDNAGGDATNATAIEIRSSWPRRKIMTATLTLIILAALALAWQMFYRKLTTLSEEEVKTMLIKNDFFDSLRNEDGKGNTHGYKIETINGDTIVRDETAKLLWQKSGSSSSMNYADAEKYVRNLNTKEFAGFNDWRMPTLEEAMSLMERETKHGGLYIDPVFDKTQRWIWTADKQSTGVAWVAAFYGGGCFNDYVTNPHYVRVVR